MIALRSIAAALATFLLAPRANAEPEIVVQDTSRVVTLQDVHVHQDRGGRLRLEGWVRRAPGSVGVINEHLHVEFLSDAGVIVTEQDGSWRGRLSIRDREAAPFSVRLDERMLRDAVQVRLSTRPPHN